MTPKIPSEQLENLIAAGLEEFYRRRLAMLEKLQLKKVMRRKNPYLFRALGIEVAAEIVQRLLQDFVSASDETIFGDAFFEPIAREASGGKVSDARGVDFVLEKPKRYTPVALKSGPNIFNASQRKRQDDEFRELRSRLVKIHKQFDPLLAYAYGKRIREASGKWIFRELSGQVFWTEITGDPDFYLKIIRLMEDIPARHRKQHQEEWAKAVNRFTAEFITLFCFKDGRIDWEKLVKFVSEGNVATTLAKAEIRKKT